MSVRLPPFQSLLDAHRADVYRFCVATVGAVEADDCFQETWIAALRAYPSLRRADNLRAWLFRIAQNKAIDAHRARVAPAGSRGVGARAGGGAGGRRRRRRQPAGALGERAGASAQAANRGLLPRGARHAVRRAGAAARVLGGRRAGATCTRA